MASPQGGYPPQGYSSPDQYGQNPSQQYDQQQLGYEGTTSPVQGGQPAPAAGGRKKRAYAGQAFDFGAGANSALGGQQQGAGPPGGGGYPGAQGAAYGGYPSGPQQPGIQQPPYGAEQGAPLPMSPVGYGQPGAGVGGYQPPAPAYPAHGAAAALGGTAGMTQQFSQMGMGDNQQQAAPQQVHQRLNQLYPTDLMSAPFNVSELDLPPPPIILPPNVSVLLLLD